MVEPGCRGQGEDQIFRQVILTGDFDFTCADVLTALEAAKKAEAKQIQYSHSERSDVKEVTESSLIKIREEIAVLSAPPEEVLKIIAEFHARAQGLIVIPIDTDRLIATLFSEFPNILSYSTLLREERWSHRLLQKIAAYRYTL